MQVMTMTDSVVIASVEPQRGAGFALSYFTAFSRSFQAIRACYICAARSRSPRFNVRDQLLPT
jgi:hypothetical protein